MRKKLCTRARASVRTHTQTHTISPLELCVAKQHFTLILFSFYFYFSGSHLFSSGTAHPVAKQHFGVCLRAHSPERLAKWLKNSRFICHI